MNIYIPLAILLALFCFFMRQREAQAKRAFLWSFFIAYIFAAIRYKFGPDYEGYWNIYDNIHGSDVSSYTSIGASAEKWFLSYLSAFPSYTFFIVVNTLLWFLANYLFLSKYAKGEDSWLLILYFFFNTTYFRLSLVAMRSAMSAFIFIFALLFFLKYRDRKYSRFVFAALIILAGQFHTSCLALIPMVFLTTSNKSVFFSPWLLVVSGLTGIISFMLGENVFVQTIGNYIIDNVDSMSRYSEEEGYVIGAISGTFFTLVFMAATLVIAYYLIKAGEKETNPTYIVIYKIAILASMVQLMFGQGMIQERYFMFFNPCYIVALLRAKERNLHVLNMLVLIIVAASSIYIMQAKMSRNYSRSFQEYHTIFSAPSIP